MKRKIMILVLALVFCFIGCKKEKADFTYDKENPEAITITTNSEITRVTIIGEGTTKELSSSSSLISEDKKTLTFDKDYFMNLFTGSYTITVTTSSNTLEKKLIVKNYITTTKQTTKEEMFDINEYAYYVIYTKDDCSACERAKDDIMRFNDFCYTYKSKLNSNAYFIDGSKATTSTGSISNLLGIDSSELLIKLASMGTPTIMYLKDGVISEVANGVTDIKKYVNEKIDFVQQTKVTEIDLQNPEPLAIELDFTPTNYTLRGPSVNNKGIDVTTSFSDKTFTLKEEILNKLYNGTYDLFLYNDTASKHAYFNCYNGIDYTYSITSEENYKFDKASPSDIIIQDVDQPNYITINGNHYYEEITDLSTLFTNSQITLKSDYLYELFPGKYEVKLFFGNQTKSFVIKVENYMNENKDFTITDKENCFSIPEDTYFVYYSREGCAYCSKVEPVMLMFNDYTRNMDNPDITSLYHINTKYGSKYIYSEGSNSNLVGIDSSEKLIKDASMGTPTLMVFEKNVIVSYLTNATDIITYFYNIMRIDNYNYYVVLN